MTSLIDGQLADTPVATNSRSGEFKRADSSFHGEILRTQAGPDRFHLYVSYACPWAHRTLIARNIKKLQDYITLSVTDPYMGDKGWTFDNSHDPKYLAVVYVASDKKYTGKITVPVLWDKKKRMIVNNESSEILRNLNSAFDHLTGSDIDLYPEVLKEQIDEINDKIYHRVNNGVYKTGFATSQAAYEKACHQLFETLDEMEVLLGERPFLTGEKVTEADIRFFTTLVRFDPVYFSHFKCNIRRIKDYPQLYDYLKCLYQIPEFKETCHFDHIKEHYYRSHPFINPTQIVPLGPELELDGPHRRGKVNFYRGSARHN